MSGRRVRNNCPFCQHPERDLLEQQIRTSVLEVGGLDRDQGWPSGASHRHMRRHADDYHNNSNPECPICVHTERAEIESAVIDGRASIADFAYELGLTEEVIEQHMKKHTQPLIKREARIEVLPAVLRSVNDSLTRVETNMNRLDNIFGLQLDRLEAQFIETPEIITPKDIELAVRLHREVRETLTELAKWMDKMEVIDKTQSVSVITIIQAHFAEKSPDEWRTLRKALADAGVME